MRYLLLFVALMCAGWSATWTVDTIVVIVRGISFDVTFVVLRLLIIVCPAMLAYWLLLTEQVGVL